MNSVVRQFLVLGLLLAAVVVLFIAAESGQRQLAAASRRVEKGAAREHALATLQNILSRAESGQRGYILLGDDAYLTQYREGLERLPASLGGCDTRVCGRSARRARGCDRAGASQSSQVSGNERYACALSRRWTQRRNCLDPHGLWTADDAGHCRSPRARGGGGDRGHSAGESLVAQ